MSYENPRIFVSDPYAFQKGFDTSFDRFTAMYSEAKAERDRLKKESEAAMATGYNASSMESINGIDTKINDALQSSLNSVIEKGDFANASTAEKSKMIQKLGLMKSSFQKLGTIASVDPDDWDVRNDKKITSLRNALMSGDESLQISGEGLDIKIKGKFGELTLDDISNAVVKNKKPYEDAYEGFVGEFQETAQKIAENAVKSGKPMENVNQELKKMFFNKLKSEGPEFLSYIYSNVADEEVHDANKSLIYGDPEITKQLSPDRAQAFTDAQFNTMADNLFGKTMDGIIDPDLYLIETPRRQARQPQPKQYKKTQQEISREIKAEKLDEKIKRIDETSFGEVFEPLFAYETSNGGIDFKDPNFHNKLASLGFLIDKFETDAYGNMIMFVQDQLSKAKVVINSSGLTEETLKEQLAALAGASNEQLKEIKKTESGLPIYKK